MENFKKKNALLIAVICLFGLFAQAEDMEISMKRSKANFNDIIHNSQVEKKHLRNKINTIVTTADSESKDILDFYESEENWKSQTDIVDTRTPQSINSKL